MADKTIREELIDITGVEQRAKESEDKFLTRLCRAASDDSIVKEDAWEKLSDGAQAWVGTAVDAMNEKKGPPTFPDESGKSKDDKGKDKSKDDKGKGGNSESKTVSRSPVKGKGKKKDAKPSKPKETAEKDAFGLRIGTARSNAAAMFSKGAKMSDVKSETGTNHYNLLKQLVDAGHTVEKDGSVITLTASK